MTPMPVLRLFTFIACVYFLCMFSSCCSEDKNCAAGSPSIGQLPYALNEQLVFKDTLGKTIRVQLANSYNTSPSYIIEGTCSTPHKEIDCSASLSIVASSIIDSNNFLPANQKGFGISIEQQSLVNQQLNNYSVNAFGAAFITGTYKNGEITLYQCSPINQYTTPSKVYPLAYEFISNNSFGVNKSVSTPTGRLISFTLHSDTAHVFYIVE
jgi:hypothetical protein